MGQSTACSITRRSPLKQPTTIATETIHRAHNTTDSPEMDQDAAPFESSSVSPASSLQPTVAPTDAWVHVEIALYDHFYEPDVQAARAFYAAMAAHDLPRGQPVWPMVIAPPSC